MLQTFSSSSKLKRHQLFHTGIKHFSFNYNNGTKLGKVLALKNRKKPVYFAYKQLNCFLCCKRFRTTGDKNNHMNNHYGINVQLRQNSVNILQQSSLTTQVETQPAVNIKQKFSGSKCLTTFSRKSILKQHHLVNTKVKSFQCIDCDMKFTTSSNLKSHQRSKHTFEKPFKCNICDMKFTQSRILKNHQRSKHTFENHLNAMNGK